MRWIVLAILVPFLAAAHELDTAVTYSPSGITVKATYAGTEPVPFARVQVFSPAAPGKEFQSGTTDKDGAFSFTPNQPGAWKVVVDDQEGHRREIDIEFPERAGSSNSGESPGMNRWARAALGLALILGAAAGAARFFRSKKSAG